MSQQLTELKRAGLCKKALEIILYLKIEKVCYYNEIMLD